MISIMSWPRSGTRSRESSAGLLERSKSGSSRVLKCATRDASKMEVSSHRSPYRSIKKRSGYSKIPSSDSSRRVVNRERS